MHPNRDSTDLDYLPALIHARLSRMAGFGPDAFANPRKACAL